MAMQDSHEIGPAEDVYEYSTFTSDITFAELGGWCRVIEIVSAGSGSLVVRTHLSGSTDRTLTGLSVGDKLGPCRFTQITASGTNVARVRCFR